MTIREAIVGRIVKVEAFFGLDTYILDNGYTWSDSSGRHAKGDVVRIEPFIMNTVRVFKLDSIVAAG